MDDAQIQADMTHDVVKLTPEQLSQREVFVENGKLVDLSGAPIQATGLGRPIEYVMATNGKLYIATRHSGIFNHSQFLGNVPVAAAGMIEVDANGKVVMIDNKSGHYKPGPSLTLQAVWVLEQKGVEMPKPTVHVPAPRANLPPPPMGGPPTGGPPTGGPPTGGPPTGGPPTGGPPTGGPPTGPALPRGKKKRVYAAPEQTGEGSSGTPQ